MMNKKTIGSTKLFMVFLFCGLIIGLPNLARAERAKPLIEGMPGDTDSAGRRDSCFLGEKPLTALIPVTEKNIGLTVSSHPTFFIYVPETKNSIQTAEFILEDDQGNTLYQIPVKLAKTSGVISVTIPATSTANELQIGKKYHWIFSLNCDLENPENNPYVESWIQRVNPPATLLVQLDTATPRELPLLYANAGIWHETLTTLVKLRQENPRDMELENYWINILRSVGLNDIAQEPLAQS